MGVASQREVHELRARIEKLESDVARLLAALQARKGGRPKKSG
jgi:uncharacterized small protein (DUF1192 family)